MPMTNNPSNLNSTPEYTCAVVALLRDADVVNRILKDTDGVTNPRANWTIEAIEAHLKEEHYPTPPQ
jgi:hypothetical protein